MDNKIIIYQTGELYVKSAEFYGEKSINNLGLPSGRMTIPVFSFLVITGKGKNILIDPGFSSKYPLGKSFLLRNFLKFTYPYKVFSQIGDLLRNDGIKQIDYIYITHFHVDHFSGLNELVSDYDIRIGKIYADSEGLNKIFSFKSIFSGFDKKLLEGINVVPVQDCTYTNGKYHPFNIIDDGSIQCFNFSGHCYGDLGFLVTNGKKKVMICADALEGPETMVDIPEKAYTINFDKYVFHIQNLRKMAEDNGAIMLSSHDIHQKITGKDFFENGYLETKERQIEILKK